MSLEIGSTYKLTFHVADKTLTFTGKIVESDEDFITFLDKFGEKLAYRKGLLISYEEVKND